MTLFALYDNVFSFTGHALWAALLAPSNLPGAAHGSQDLIYVWNLIDNLNIVEMYGDARCSNTGVVQKEDTLSLSLCRTRVCLTLFCSGRQLSRAAGELFLRVFFWKVLCDSISL